MCLRGRANDSADILERVPQVEEEMNKDIARWGSNGRRKAVSASGLETGCAMNLTQAVYPCFQLCLPGEITTMIRGTVAFTRTTLLHLG